MATPNSRQNLIDYCLRALGEPVLEVNVDPDQIEDRVDEALQYWQEYHSEATYKTYVSHLVGDSDVSNQYVDLDSDVLWVNRLFRVSTGSTGAGMFDIKYQFILNDVANMGSFMGDLAYYVQLKQYMEILDQTLNGTPQTIFSRKMNRLYIMGDFVDTDIQSGDYIVYEAMKTIDVATHTSAFNDMWLKRYTTALIKRQWGQNLSKFEGMQLPGGVMLNGRQLLDDANSEIEILQEKIRMEHEFPVDFYVG